MKQKHILEEPVASTVISHRFSHVVWGSIFAGTVMVMAIELFLMLLGSGIGLSVLDVHQGTNVKTLGVGALVWWIISGMVAFYFGGQVAGRMAGIPRQQDGMLHGLLTWGLTTILMFVILTSTMGMLISGGFGLLKSAGDTAAQSVPAMADTMNISGAIDGIRADVNQVFNQRANPGIQAQVLGNQITSLFDSSASPEFRHQQVVNILTQNTNLSQTEANDMVNRWEQNMQQAKDKIQDAAATASKAAGGGALASCAMLILSAVAAGVGGSMGAPHWSEQEIA